MKVSYDKSVDAAYISIKENTMPGESKHTYPCNPLEVNGAMIVLDFDKDFVLLGIEVQDASKHLPKSLLESAEIK